MLVQALLTLLVLQGIIGSPAPIKELRPRAEDEDSGKGWYKPDPAKSLPPCRWEGQHCQP
ncbi:hypothetical protein PGT21_007035 [Puccinia graminis f. sp. tritici]|uniref:Uncharacterized protein n=1 Tax=Puccinia graminis f. sp. tritici TaxID=56615 RepID=A0A5B0SIX8_PUCGR|nr:hypothetical protein PGT21_007035 [Puccinia graminis f. sp. tritici]KAA1137730.1 hypothetical protein PGTUg99_008296 [Puccinia graminis f. sp. tritici]